MRVEILDEAQDDLLTGYHFYEEQALGLGSYFLDSLLSDIESLLLYAGIHQMVYGSHRSLAKRFPFAIYYRVETDIVRVRAILHCRRNPRLMKDRLERA